MIVRQNKSIETNSLFPNSDWYNQGNYVVEDGTPLAQKIKDSAPYMDLIVENGVLVDIIPLEKPVSEPTELEPTTEEMLLLALSEIAELKTKVAILEGS